MDPADFKKKIKPDTNKIPKHLFQGYLNIYNNYFKAPWMPDRTEANSNELNQDDARYGFRCCHLKNIWTAPLPPETELSRQIFFFSSRRRHTRFDCVWSSDVCSSDLAPPSNEMVWLGSPETVIVWLFTVRVAISELPLAVAPPSVHCAVARASRKPAEMVFPATVSIDRKSVV